MSRFPNVNTTELYLCVHVRTAHSRIAQRRHQAWTLWHCYIMSIQWRIKPSGGSDEDNTACPSGLCSNCFSHVLEPFTNGIEDVVLCAPCLSACKPCPSRHAFSERDMPEFTCQLCGERSNPTNNPWNPGRPVRDTDYRYTGWVCGECEICTACYEALDE